MNEQTTIEPGPIQYHPEVEQGTEDWLAMRCGKLCASEMKHIITPTLKVANNDKTRSHVFEIAFQRLTGVVEPQYVSDAMLRGQADEIYARAAYDEHYAPVDQTGFVTNSVWGFTVGYSPDGLVGHEGLIECKSRCGKYHVQTVAEDAVPEEYMIQLQTGLLVTERKWIDFVSYCGGMPLYVKRVYPNEEIQGAIVMAAVAFEERVLATIQEYRSTLTKMPKLIETQRLVEEEMVL